MVVTTEPCRKLEASATECRDASPRAGLLRLLLLSKMRLAAGVGVCHVALGGVESGVDGF